MPGASRPPDGGIGKVHRPRLNPKVILTSSKEPAWGGLPGSPPGQVKPLGTLQGPPPPERPSELKLTLAD